MRAYKFLNEHFGLKSLSEKRIKISEIHELNDPFELIPFNLKEPKYRKAMLHMRDQLAANGRGLLCFSATWRDPVVWAHYSDKHKGICLGFEIPDGKSLYRRVRYEPKRLPFPKDLHVSADARDMLFIKYSNWAYEQEVRVWIQLPTADDGLYFCDFDDTIQLKEVIVGAKCTLSRSDITRALGTLAEHVTLIKARAGFTKFEVVRDKRGLK
jgi:hypothetical protein